MTGQRRTAQVGPECVACGCCVAVCPRGAIQIRRGVRAVVDGAHCVGCGLCVKTCPAAVIALAELEVRR